MTRIEEMKIKAEVSRIIVELYETVERNSIYYRAGERCDDDGNVIETYRKLDEELDSYDLVHARANEEVMKMLEKLI